MKRLFSVQSGGKKKRPFVFVLLFFLSSCCVAPPQLCHFTTKHLGAETRTPLFRCNVFLGCNCIPSVGAQEQKSNTISVNSVSNWDAAILIPVPGIGTNTGVEHSTRTCKIRPNTSCRCMYMTILC